MVHPPSNLPSITFEQLEELSDSEYYKPDVVLYDVLGD